MDKAIKDALREIVGAENFTDSLIDLVSYANDSSDHRHRPEAAVWVRNAEQISRILVLANQRLFPVTPRGAGTSMAGTAVPARGGLVMDLGRMNRILKISLDDRLVVVEPGVVYAALDEALNPLGFFFPPDPASGKVCTIGGNVATNAGGIRGAKYGVTRDYVLGLSLVLPDGRIMKTGGECLKSSSGYDLTRLLVGSEGTLAVVTEIILKVSPRPKAFKTTLAAFGDLAQAGAAVIEVMRSGIVPSVMEIMDENTIRILKEHAQVDLPEARALLLCETDGYTEAEAAFQMDTALAVFKKNQATEIRVAETEAQTEALWKGRKITGSTAARLRPSSVAEDVTVPMSKVPEALTGISRIVRKYDLPFVVFGHAGDGNLHPRIMYDPADPDQAQRMHQAVDEIFALTCRLGGTLTGEHGIGLAKAPYMKLEHHPVALEVMRGIKRLLDPNNILNPGKMSLDD